MFARRRKKPPPAEVMAGEGAGADLLEPGPERVMRTWQAWLAATADDQAERYRAYLGALAEEEAAALAVQCASRTAPRSAREATADVAQSPPR